MTLRSQPRILALVVAAGVSAAAAVAPAANQPDSIMVGLSQSLFHEVPEALVRTTLPPHEALMMADTGLKGKIHIVPDAAQLAEELVNGKTHVGVFSGVEYAQVRQQHPKLKALAIAINKQDRVTVHVVVRQDSRATQVSELADKKLALPRGSRIHCRVSLHAYVADPKTLKRPASAEDALDDVHDGVVDAAVVDSEAVHCFQRRKPGRFAKLRDLHKPVVYPVPVLVYQEGVLDEATLRTVYRGLLKAHETERGRKTLDLWKLTRYAKVPDDYDQLFDEVLKMHPPSNAK